MKPIDRLAYWINERQAILDRRNASQAKPWTDDWILRQYRFCNVHREDDTVTQWIKRYWRDPHTSDPDVWFAMIVARVVNWPETLTDVGYPLPWRPKIIQSRMLKRKHAGQKVFTGAYMVGGGGKKKSKIDYVVFDVLDKCYELKDPPVKGDTLKTAHAKLLAAPGLGSFMAAQVVADLKYTKLLSSASDWWSWAAPGPGSVRGLRRLGYAATKTTFLEDIQRVHVEVFPKLKSSILQPGLHMQDLQSCLCEFDKYERVRLGEGQTRSKYPGDPE